MVKETAKEEREAGKRPRARRQRRRVEEESPPRQARSQRVCEGRKTLPSTNNIGSLPIAFSLTTGTAKVISVDLTNQANVFCGFCRDVTSTLTNCFEGAKDGACPHNITRRPLDTGWTREEEPREWTTTTRCCRSLFSPDFAPCLAR